MSKYIELDAFIAKNVFKEFKPNTLFLLFNNNTISYVFQNPFEIIREFWKEQYVYFGENKNIDTLSFLFNTANDLKLHVPVRYSQALLKNNDKVEEKHIQNLSLLFLIQYSIIFNDIMFGYVHLPEQTDVLLSIIVNSNTEYPANMLSHIITTANSYNAKHIKVPTLED